MAEGKSGTKKIQRVSGRKPKQKLSPLTLADFRSAFLKVDSLGLTWTADIPPHLISKKPEDDSAMPSLSSMRIQETYPTFPQELGTVTHYILTGKLLSWVSADKKLLDKKAEFISQSGLITKKYRAEYFFKHAIKVPCFSDLDWEVVVKKYERGVSGSPEISYAMLSLEFEWPDRESSRRRRIVVAANERLVNKLLASLLDVKEALEKAGGASGILSSKEKAEEKDNASTNSPKLLADGERTT